MDASLVDDVSSHAGVAASPIGLTLQTRDRESGRILATNESVDPSKIGVVIIDMWNTNDCMTNAQRAAALVPRMNKALEAARRLGMSIIWAPTDVASQYVGTPQRERAIALARYPLPHIRNFSCPFSAPTVRPDKCMCGPGIACHVHYGWDAMDPNLVIASGDWIVGDPDELYSIYKQRGLTRLIYMGINTNLCVMNKPEGIAAMTSAGLKCILARDLTDAETSYDPDLAFTPDTGHREGYRRCGTIRHSYHQYGRGDEKSRGLERSVDRGNGPCHAVGNQGVAVRVHRFGEGHTEHATAERRSRFATRWMDPSRVPRRRYIPSRWS